MHKIRARGGFTLLEVLLAAAIIGILAVIVVPEVSGYVKRVRQYSEEKEAGLVFQAVTEYFADKAANGRISVRDVQNIENVPFKGTKHVLSPYMGNVSLDGILESVLVNRKTGMVSQMVYDGKYSRIQIDVDEEGRYTLQYLEKK